MWMESIFLLFSQYDFCLLTFLSSAWHDALFILLLFWLVRYIARLSKNFLFPLFLLLGKSTYFQARYSQSLFFAQEIKARLLFQPLMRTNDGTIRRGFLNIPIFRGGVDKHTKKYKIFSDDTLITVTKQTDDFYHFPFLKANCFFSLSRLSFTKVKFRQDFERAI